MLFTCFQHQKLDLSFRLSRKNHLEPILMDGAVTFLRVVKFWTGWDPKLSMFRAEKEILSVYESSEF